MKKVVLALALAALVTGGVFAQMSIGGGFLSDISFGNGMIQNASKRNISVNNLSSGGFLFFDANYIEFDINFAYGMTSTVTTVDGKKQGTGSEDEDMMQLGFVFLGKYPLNMGSVIFFPLLGAGYNMVLSAKGYSNSDAFDLSQVSALAGAGIDFLFNKFVFLRTEALFNLRFNSKVMSDTVKAISGSETTFGMGPRIKIGFGYRF